MMTKQQLLAFCTLTLLLLTTAPTFAQKTVKIKNVTARWQVSDNVTLKEAEERARMEAKKEALRRAGVMENVWSTFGQLSTETGTELKEVYSQMNILAIGGMLNVTREVVDELWDVEAKSLFKVVTIDAEVKKEVQPDNRYALEIKGIATLYKEGDSFSCRLKVHGTDSYLKFFWFDSSGGSLIYPNEYEENMLLEAGKEYGLPFSNAIDYRMEKQQAGRDESINLMLVATKENIPFTGEVTYENVLKWVYAIPANSRCAQLEVIMIK